MKIRNNENNVKLSRLCGVMKLLRTTGSTPTVLS